MDEQEIYKHVLHEVIDQSENHQIKNTQEVVQTIIRRLKDYQLPKLDTDDVR